MLKSLSPSHDCTTFLPTPVPGTITVPPMDTTVVSPNPAVFTCVADGVSIPVITWWRQEPSIQLSSDGINVTISDRNLTSRTVQSNLTILQSQPVDTAEYVCVATNEITSATASEILTVYGKCSDMLHSYMYMQHMSPNLQTTQWCMVASTYGDT